MTKRFLCVLLCLLLVQWIPGVSAEENSVPSQDEALELALDYLRALGIDDAFSSEETVTRGQFTALTLQIMNAQLYEPQEADIFSDVDASHPWSAQIYTALTRKIINGSGGAFRPDDAITYMEAVKMLMDALGYRSYAIAQGGYPVGYLTLAASNKLLISNIDGEDALTGRDAAVLLHRALVTEVMEGVAYGDSVRYESSRGHDMLWVYFNLEKVEGILTATQNTSLTDPDYRKNANKIAIHGVSYLYGLDCEELLGRSVLAYVDRDENLQVAFLVSDHNEEVVLPADSLSRFENNVVYEEQEKKEIRHRLDVSYNLIYNGRACLEVTEEKMIPDSGSVTLVDNNQDGSYDVVLVQSYEFMKVTAVDQINQIIYGTSDILSGGIDTGNPESFFLFFEDTRQGLSVCDFSAIATGDSLACAVSENGLSGKIYLLSNSINGTVDEVSDDNHIVINGKAYTTTDSFMKTYTGLAGASGTFILGLDGRIALFERSFDLEYQYGYVIEVGQKKGLEQPYQMKVCTTSDEIVVYEIAKNCIIDGQRRDQSEIRTLFLDESGVTRRQLIKFMVNEEGELQGIDTAEIAQGLPEEAYEKGNTLLCYDEKLTSRVKSGNVIFNRFILSSGAVVFVAPDPSQTQVEEDDFSCPGSSFFRNDNEYTVATYDMGDNGYFNAIVVYATVNSNTLDDYSTGGVVEKIVDAVPGEQLENASHKKIYLWSEGNYVSYFVSEDVNLTKEDSETPIGPGDIIRYEVKGGIISQLSVDFDCAKMEFTSTGNGYVLGDQGYNRVLSYGLSSIYKKFGTYCYVSSVKNADGTYNYDYENLRGMELGSAKFVLVNRKTGYVKSIYSSDIYDYCSGGKAATELVTRSRHWNCNMAVVYVEGENET